MVTIGLRNHEILDQLQKSGNRISEATLKRDIAAVRNELRSKIEKAELHTVKAAFNEFDLLWREMWSIFYGPPPRDKQGEIHRAFWRPMIADRLIKLAEHKARLAGYLTTPTMPPSISLEAVAGKLKLDDSASILRFIREVLIPYTLNGQIGIQQSSTMVTACKTLLDYESLTELEERVEELEKQRNEVTGRYPS
jgi:BMFP domain-containing protein YqiC